MFLDENGKKVAEKLKTRTLCGNCLGRMFGRVGTGFTNIHRAEIVSLETGSKFVGAEQCELCNGIFAKIEHYARIAIELMDTVEWHTFLVGSRFDEEILAKEEKIVIDAGATNAESIKVEFNRELGKKISELTGKRADFSEPDCVVIMDTRFDTAHLEVRPLFLFGRYRKFSREIPQTRWLCRNCRGKGCRRCNWKGKMYETSVQELVATKVIEATGGKEHFFHGMGREDIDVRMLGNGRPFILEIREPVKRTLDVGKLEQEINEFARGRVEVEGLKLVSGKLVEKIKEEKATKRYQAIVEFASQILPEKLENAINELREKDIYQKTPNRVLHRRSDLTRKRRVHDLKLCWLRGHIAQLEIECDAGTYVKEFVSGDQGRTTPSIAELTGVPCRVQTLDVIRINDMLEE
ncbi:MAG: tRNA pseudouridine(54/55) synthase Pus10 [Thermoplasmata archaeon]|nr:tRNA pseudouridine(54/55) synthase Pus10 [Thermoplasmata archaeon]